MVFIGSDKKQINFEYDYEFAYDNGVSSELKYLITSNVGKLKEKMKITQLVEIYYVIPIYPKNLFGVPERNY